MHSCDNRMCINPDHLSLGTTLHNMRDMWTRGRGFLATGELSGMAKISDKSVRAIRDRVSKGTSYAELAADLGIDNSHVSRVARGLSRSSAGGPINTRLRRVPVTKDQAMEIVKLRDRGDVWVSIEKKMNLSRSAVMRAYERYKVQ